MSAEMIADVWNVDLAEIVKTLEMMKSSVKRDAWIELLRLNTVALFTQKTEIVGLASLILLVERSQRKTCWGAC